ncbi:hypothetical protein NOF04DRAFT_4202 [Fusarium oxysporum II5]|uniref:Uncharacterized protein n=3 Tax=Fusarium oxysporum species complex TaxID=171631 RepID=N1S686_FUSC4|nr:uncharacterized protein FOIG_16660 [Fusarium odoratissimum NRRL 54006]EMT73081.1 hypothetical protein FOC4_g10000357 [Fusarium odoratissimum]EXL90072.1 hypothetical protein FOIG_16660 [Fusarium odoratissimum NRRL 54006]KAK2134141.1 hypothetical protein NOF04DRAFT_4202 [Fusarium oxysporum II5]TXB97296.1 hypothetical protein FocTR4_00012004 [Fusarium oxysporum f. sp. cubense]
MVTITLKVLAGVAAFLAIANASPAEVVPSDESHPIPQEFIDGVLAYFKAHPLNGTAKRDMGNALHKRVPGEHGCDHDDHWVSRMCLSDVGPREYEDECQDEDGEEYQADGICPELTYCSEVIERGHEHQIHDIICMPATPPREDNIGTKGQYGYRTVQAVNQRGVTELEKSISLQEDIAGASVSGHVRSTDRTFIIDPANTLTANLHGFQLNVCKEDKGDKHHDSRICKPTRRVNLKKGNTIDFTFGLSYQQSGILFYGILRS